MRLLKRFDVRLILVSALFLLLTLVAVTTLIADQYQGALLEQSEQQTAGAFEQAEAKIDNLLQTARKNANLLLKREEVSNFLYGHFPKESERVVALVKVMNSINATIHYNSGLSGVWFFHEDGTVIGATEVWNFASENQPHPIFEELDFGEIAQWESVTWLGGWWLEEITRYPTDRGHLPEDVMILGVLRNRYRLNSGDPHIIYTMFSIDEQMLGECFEMLGNQNEDVYLLDDQGRQMVGPTLENLKHVPWFWPKLNATDGAGSTALINEGSEYQVVYRRLQSTGWTLVKLIPFEVYAGRINHLRSLAWGIGLSILLVALVLYSLWVIHFVRPFKEMSEALERVQQGDLSVQMCRPSGVYEFELMRGEFNSMIQSIQRLLKQTKEMEHERIELELRTLQSQLNPHMVFNSITAIRWMAMMSGADKLGDMLVELAELIRPIYTEWRLVWSLGDEVTYVGHYLKLLSLRYGGLVSADIYLDETLMQTSLPCFTLQPLLENSAEHGFRDGKALLITVEGVRLKDGRIRLCVRDNGCGMPQEKIETLYQRMNEEGLAPKPKDGVGHTGIGLINIYRRLKMFLGESSTMTIESAEKQGTTITLEFFEHQESTVYKGLHRVGI